MNNDLFVKAVIFLFNLGIIVNYTSQAGCFAYAQRVQAT